MLLSAMAKVFYNIITDIICEVIPYNQSVLRHQAYVCVLKGMCQLGSTREAKPVRVMNKIRYLPWMLYFINYGSWLRNQVGLLEPLSVG